MKSRTQPVKIGVDTKVKVQLTEFGWSLYENYFSTNNRPKTPNGYLTMSLATLMNIYGSQLNTLSYDERFSVFVNNEIIYSIPNLLIHALAGKIEDNDYKDSLKRKEKWAEKMRSFKTGDKVSLTIGYSNDVYTYVCLTHFLGREVHEVKDNTGRIHIVQFFELEYAKQS